MRPSFRQIDASVESAFVSCSLSNMLGGRKTSFQIPPFPPNPCHKMRRRERQPLCKEFPERPSRYQPAIPLFFYVRLRTFLRSPTERERARGEMKPIFQFVPKKRYRQAKRPRFDFRSRDLASMVRLQWYRETSNYVHDLNSEVSFITGISYRIIPSVSAYFRCW